MADPSPPQSLTRATLVTYATRIATVALGLAITIVVTRALGPDGRGEVALAGALATTLVQLGLLGLHAANTYRVSRNPDELPPLVGNTLAVSLVGGGIIAAAVAGAAGVWPSLVAVHGGLLALVMTWVPLGIASLLLSHLLLGLHDVRGYNTAELITRIASFALAGGVVLLGSATPFTIFVGWLVALVLGVGYCMLRLKRHLGAPLCVSGALLRESLAYGSRAWVVCLCGYLVTRLDLLIVGHALGPHETGLYSIAVSLGDQLLLLPTSLAAVIFPRLSAEPDAATRFRAALRATAVTALLLGTLTAACVAVSPWLIETLFGAAFANAAVAWRWLAPGVFLYGLEIVIAQYLSGSGFPPAVMGLWIVIAAGNLGATLWAVPRYGIVGAAAVTSGTYAVLLVAITAVAAHHARRGQG